jgi:hypothetical protein
MSTASAPRASALNTSAPERMPPSTKILKSGPSGRAYLRAGRSRWEGRPQGRGRRGRRPRCRRRPASRHMRAARGVMTPLTMNGSLGGGNDLPDVGRGISGSTGFPKELEIDKPGGVHVHGRGDGARSLGQAEVFNDLFVLPRLYRRDERARRMPCSRPQAGGKILVPGAVRGEGGRAGRRGSADLRAPVRASSVTVLQP